MSIRWTMRKKLALDGIKSPSPHLRSYICDVVYDVVFFSNG